LKQVAIAGINPDSEPSVKSLEAIGQFAQENNVSTIFFETLLPADLATTLASEIGAKTDLLDPIEGFSQEDLDNGSNYIVAQRANLERLRRGLQCK
jgi:zinc transport system substrate-binding protein